MKQKGKKKKRLSLQSKAKTPPSSTQTTLMLSAVGTWYWLIPPPTEGAIVGEEVTLADDTSIAVGSSVCKYSVCWCCFLVVLVEVVDAGRVTSLEDDLGPEGKKATDEETKGSEVNREVDCERRGSVLVIDTKEVLVGARQCSLTEPPPGAWIWPELDSQPLGRPVEVGEPVATQGQTLGVTKLEVSRWVPLHGTGTLSTVAVISGADWVDVGSSALFPFTLPPLETIDSHEPD
jgi:hypothetical protein